MIVIAREPETPAANAPMQANAAARSRSWLFANRYNLLIFLLFALVTGPIFIDPVRHDAPKADQGRISFADWGPLASPVQLTGNWTLEWLTAPGTADRQPVAIAVPGPWAGKRAASGAQFPAGAAMRYRLTVSGLTPGPYRLYISPIYGANRVFANGRLLGSYGRFGFDSATSRYHVRAHDLSFDSDGSDVELTIEISTFRDIGNGMNEPPVLGTPAAMQLWVALQWAKEFLFDAALILVGLFGLVVYFSRRAERAALYLGLSAFSFLLPMVIFGFENIWMLALPRTPFAVMMGVLWLGSWIALCFWMPYVRALFPQEVPARAYRAFTTLLAGATLVQAGALVIGGTLAGSIVNRAIFVAFVAAFVMVIWITIRAIRAGRSEAVLLLFGQAAYFISLMMMLVISYGIVSYDRVTGIDFASFGVLVFLLTHIMILAQRWSASIEAAEALNSDLSQLLDINSAVTSEARLETLLMRIVAVASRILHAERSSLFLHDPQKSELWSLVAEGLETREIRIADTSGIAGHVFKTSRLERVQDAYADPRFAADVDTKTGFRTRNLMAAPIVARDGRKLGVLQVLNSLNGNGFSASDEARLAAFAAQAAIAIDNAQLFSEVVASRNFNESILQSMSAGVITLQQDGRQARLNESAARILRVPRDQAEAADARAFLEASNPWLLPEIDSVAETGQPKSLLDTELVTAAGKPVSANISIVPLRDADATTGVLLMVDDISSSKRLESTMRRFMTQDVMDQVLAQGGDDLFGASCNASVLFADIRNFTTLAETLTPRDTVDMLNEIFTDLFEAVSGSDGVLDKYIGDAIMAVFGAPISSGHDAMNAVQAAVRMQEMMAAINQRRAGRDASALRLGIGISSGEVIAGTIGSPKRMDYTVIGDSVNLASRLQDATKTYGVGIIVCERTAAQVKGAFVLEELDRIRVKGRVTEERIFSVSTAN